MFKWLLTLTLLLHGLPAWASPTVWVVRGPHATVYLFGSLHMLRPGTEWQSPALRRAFDAASNCWFEVNQQDDDPEKLKALVGRIGFEPGQKLSALLTPEKSAKLSSMLAQPGGASKRDLGQMRPWLAAWTLAYAVVSEAGYEPDFGVDKVLQDQARAAGKSVAGLETMEGHLHMLADIPQDTALHQLDNALDNAAKVPEMMQSTVKHWQAGDVEAADIATESWTFDAPDFYDALLVKRNVSFANAIEDFSNGKETVLVTVGAGHFAGPGNVREMLKARGIQVERVPD